MCLRCMQCLRILSITHISKLICWIQKTLITLYHNLWCVKGTATFMELKYTFWYSSIHPTPTTLKISYYNACKTDTTCCKICLLKKFFLKAKAVSKVTSCLSWKKTDGKTIIDGNKLVLIRVNKFPIIEVCLWNDEYTYPHAKYIKVPFNFRKIASITLLAC